MADRYDRERDWDRDRNWGRDVGGNESEERRRERGWDWDRRSEYAGEGPRGGHEGNRWETENPYPNQNRWGHDDERVRRNERGGDAGWQNSRYSGPERSAQRGPRGDWGPQGHWGTFGNRPGYDRENDQHEDPALRWARTEDDLGGARTGRSNLFGTGGGGFGSGMASYGAGMGNFEGTATYGGGIGRHAGRGPKGWQRSDDRIREDVNERLTDHPHIDASEIEVQVQNGEVTLSGTVEERQAKRLAEDIAEAVSGVRDVHNQIRVQQGERQHTK